MDLILDIVKMILGISIPVIGGLALIVFNGVRAELKELKSNFKTVNTGINELNTTITTLLERDINKNDRIKENKVRLNKQDDQIQDCRDRLHSLEGAYKQFGEFIDEVKPLLKKIP